MTRSLLLIVLAGVAVGACGNLPAGQPAAGPASSAAGPASSAGASSAHSSVISGTVSAGPISPISRPGHANSRPVPADRVEAMRGSELVSVTYTDHEGRFRFTLPPGTYVIAPSTSGFRFARPQSKTVIALAGREHTVDFLLDTGIR